MLLLAAKPVTEATYAALKAEVEHLARAHGRAPHLSVILVGDNPASQVYVRQKGKVAVELGMTHETLNFPKEVRREELRDAVMELNQNPRVDGILIQRPLPPQFREEELVYWVDPSKDVDAFHPENTGRLQLGLPCFQPCTPAGIMLMLKHYGIHPNGKVACVIGRSSIVGKPMATLLLQANATVIHCHSKTPDLPRLASQADILVAAIGKAQMVDASYIKPGAVVIDVGMNRLPSGKLVGDVNFEEVSTVASAITPVPGGVGPMTILMLMTNTVRAARDRLSKSP